MKTFNLLFSCRGFFCGAYLEFPRESALWPSDGDLLLITEPCCTDKIWWQSQLLPNRDFNFNVSCSPNSIACKNLDIISLDEWMLQNLWWKKLGVMWWANKLFYFSPSTRDSRYLSNSASFFTASSDTWGAFGKQTNTILILSRLPWRRKRKKTDGYKLTW